MRDKDWELLYELYKTPNITRVANKLYMTQPTLTKRLQAIEAELQVRVVDRSIKGVKFTPEGEFLAKRAEKYVSFMEELYRDLRTFQEEQRRNITIGSSYTFSRNRLPEILFQYYLQNPNVKVTIVNDQSDVLYRKLLDGEIDVAFIRNDFEGPVRRILLEKSPGYIISKEPVKLRELENMPFIEYRTNGKTRELLDRWWYERFDGRRNTRMNAGYVDFVWEFLAKGNSYTLSFSLDMPKAEYHFCFQPMTYLDGSPVVRNTWFICRAGHQQTPVVAEFEQFVGRLAKERETEKQGMEKEAKKRPGEAGGKGE